MKIKDMYKDIKLKIQEYGFWFDIANKKFEWN